MILDKILKVLTSLLLFKTDLDIMFDDVLNKNNAFYTITRTLLVALSPWGLEISFVVKGTGAVILIFHLEYKTRVICHNVNTQNVKIARKDRPHILVSNQRENFENLLHIDNAPVRRTLSEILHSKK